ncbi:DUF4355 domain-containing protein [Clostridium botulinum]|uniref:DUF4355 domain-containing protein n=1 Tax=Clostridium botulinum TaxID=1491 RepID=UPI0019675C77|nr:DUF4355 domain-containing protein [Clostridium botulinum]MBN1079307.1 DUF4355 domain-containing protein [Clostridium botulinum]
MIKSELLKKIEKAKDDEDINSLLAGTDIEETFKGEDPTLDVFKGKIKSDKVFQQFMDSERDTYHSKALKTMKEKGTWENEFSNELHTKYPDLITDPTQKELIQLKADLEKERAANVRKDLLTEAVKYANEKGIKLSAIDKFLGDDLDTTKSNLDALAEDWSKGIEAVVEQKMKVNSYIPGISGEGDPVSIGESLAVKANESKSAPSDPWA